MKKGRAKRESSATFVVPEGTLDREPVERGALWRFGESLREKLPRKSHARFAPADNRPDPVDVLIRTDRGRIAELVPIRYGRMMRTPFTFFRGAAAIMAGDLATTPSTGIIVQACGDSHVLNFGGFGTPERRVIFDINDFDETNPAPWEWDIRRLAASVVIASRENGLRNAAARDAAVAAVRAYRKRMSDLAAAPALDSWFRFTDYQTMIDDTKRASIRRAMTKSLRNAMNKSSIEGEEQGFVRDERGNARIKDDPPNVYHVGDQSGALHREHVVRLFERYRASLPFERQSLFDRYRLADVARKVVGTGSVGTECSIALFFATEDDPLILQVKEAHESVLEPYTSRSAFANHGQRVVVGQRVMQTATDTFLGWTESDDGRHFYVRRLHDVKIKPPVEGMRDLGSMIEHATDCGHALARAHARSGNAVVIAGYMDKGATLDEAIGDFAVAYADQNEKDHATLLTAIRSGRVEARVEE